MKYFYNKYLGGIFPLANVYSDMVRPVFREDLVYKDVTSYLDGAMVSVDYNYMVPVIETGVVVYIGDKEGYEKVVIIEGDNGVDIWYGNLADVMVNIYDVVDKGSYLGSVNEDSLYLVYSKENKFLDYNNYLY
jgi:murein DD-endopeptidase MepM/ murein hydrolase activator NlpD